jgi:hypothetical protein
MKCAVEWCEYEAALWASDEQHWLCEYHFAASGAERCVCGNTAELRCGDGVIVRCGECNGYGEADEAREAA